VGKGLRRTVLVRGWGVVSVVHIESRGDWGGQAFGLDLGARDEGVRHDEQRAEVRGTGVRVVRPSDVERRDAASARYERHEGPCLLLNHPSAEDYFRQPAGGDMKQVDEVAEDVQLM
jgi:hypothetical protein